MQRLVLYLVAGAALTAAVLAGTFFVSGRNSVDPDEVLAAYRDDADYGSDLSVRYPLDETLFPPESVPPTFRWQDAGKGTDAWVITFDFQDGPSRISAACNEPEWTPSQDQWADFKRRSVERPVRVTILGIDRAAPQEIRSAAHVAITTSKDAVGAPLFYREVNLPFIDAWKDPASHIRWRFGPISSPEPPPIVLDKVPNCANCHSFTADGKTLAMEVDSANDKGSYVISPVEKEMVFDPQKIITWSDYRREDKQQTFGLLPQISPDGRYVVCMVKDRSVFVATPGIEFSQLFFPIQGILVYYDRQSGTFHALPGADDREFVQGNPTWSPDGKYVVFARSKVHRLKAAHDVRSGGESRMALLNRAECERFLAEVGTFQYDLYRIPFNEGNGGKAVPIQGASNNGKSNYFAKYSPDGKWIVFCQAQSFMLLQPDSELFIIPAEGGEARRLRCNTPRMNSWHSWSPNGKWLVFSSKWNSPYTQLWLTHIDEQGQSTPPVVLANMTEKDRAANIPEFVNQPPDAIAKIYARYLDDTYYWRAAGEFRRQLDYENAIPMYEKALDINPNSAESHTHLADCLIRQGKIDEAKPHLLKAVELAPENGFAHERLGTVLAEQGMRAEAIAAFRIAVHLKPQMADAQFRLGVLLAETGDVDGAGYHLGEAIRFDPAEVRAHLALGALFSSVGDFRQAAHHFSLALESDPKLLVALLQLAAIRATSDDPALRNGEEALELAERACQLTEQSDPTALVVLAQAQADLGRFADAIEAAERARRIVLDGGHDRAASAIQQQIELFQKNQPYRQSTFR